MARGNRESQTKKSFWFRLIGGGLLLSVVGFGLGILLGVVFEEPNLLVGHVAGDTEEVLLEPAKSGTALTLPPLKNAKLPDPETFKKREEKAKLPPVSAAPPNKGRFVIQVGAFSNSAQANAVAKNLKTKGYDCFVTPGTGAGDARWRVRVGPMPYRKDAEQVALRLKKQEKLPTWIISEGG